MDFVMGLIRAGLTLGGHRRRHRSGGGPVHDLLQPRDRHRRAHLRVAARRLVSGRGSSPHVDRDRHSRWKFGRCVRTAHEGGAAACVSPCVCGLVEFRHDCSSRPRSGACPFNGLALIAQDDVRAQESALLSTSTVTPAEVGLYAEIKLDPENPELQQLDELLLRLGSEESLIEAIEQSAEDATGGVDVTTRKWPSSCCRQRSRLPQAQTLPALMI